jgi:TPR repeat protein
VRHAVDEIKFPIGGMRVTLANSFECHINGGRCCSVECREDHEERHDEECNEPREELHDKKLFTQPDISHLGECPICFLPMPLDPTKSVFWSCCSENICNGCDYANDKNNGGDRCPCCREVLSEEECDKKLMERIEANDPAALHQMGAERFDEGDYEGAFEYLTKAAELGDAGAHYRLGLMYEMGNCVDKDKKQAVYHYETAAIGGHPKARGILGCLERENGDMQKSVKHFIIAANLGYDTAMNALGNHYFDGNISKEDLDAALCAHEAAINAMKSPEREAADEYPKTQAAIELHDKKLFTQPSQTHLGECPICFLPLSIDPKTRIFWTCCSEAICKGCVHANMMSNGKVKAEVCLFCREPAAKKEETNRRLMKRVKANDPAALCFCGMECYQEGDYDVAFKYWTKAAELGDIQAHHELGFMYIDGKGIEKDAEKSIHHYEKAAIGGHPQARHNLALYEECNGNVERAVKHFIIAAKLGYEASMKVLWKHYSLGNITKEDLDATLRAHQAALDATKSEQREKVEEAIKNGQCPIFGGLH